MPLNTNTQLGLTSLQVARAPKNTAPGRISEWGLRFRVIKNQIVSFFFLLLVVSGALSFFLHQHVDAIIFFVIAGINSVIGFFEEYHANKSAQALEKIVAHSVTVRRNGVLRQIPHGEVVLGDIVVLAPGAVAVTDMLIRESENAFFDESIVTGETLPRVAVAGEAIVSGVTLVSGSIVGEVTAVGKETSLMQYAEKVSKVEKDNGFDRFIYSISRAIVLLTAGCLLLVLVANVFLSHSMALPEYVIYAISMLVGVVPESLPLIVTIILTREALILSKHKVLIKKLSVLENLGSMQYLFTDKTGTITENNLRVSDVVDLGGLRDSIATIAYGAYERTPMDGVFDAALLSYVQSVPQAPSELRLSPFSLDRGYAVYTLADGGEIVRGQYQAVEKLCADTTQDFLTTCASYEKKGHRVIAFATKASGLTQYVLEGAVVFEDPLKSDAVRMYHELSALGVEVKVITGDSVDVATSVGSLLVPGLSSDRVYAMDAWTSDGTDSIEQYFMYARCKPEQKSLLIDEHLDHGVVGFLGEGINDALALKRADIGFVVSNGSDVARQSGDVILLEKSLSPVVAAVKLSREAFIKVRTYLLCTLTGNVGTLLSLTAVTVFSRQLPMLPIQVLLNNILTDVPLMFLITDTISPGSLDRPIRGEGKKFLHKIVVFGVLITLFDFVFFALFRGYGIEVLRTGWFVFSVCVELTLVFVLRSDMAMWKAPRISTILGSVIAFCIAIAFLLPYSPLGVLFHLTPLSLVQVGIIVGLAVGSLAAGEVVKYLIRTLRRSVI